MATEKRKDQWRKSYFRNRDKIKAKVEEKKLENPALFLFYKAKHRAKKNNLQLGYVKGNVQVISWRANRIKNDGSLHEFEMLVKYLTSI